ncbi:Lrp/AsnC family transcriptional regulator [Arthrobacter cavernae]|uniref:Lrp/AsnC family transcriptional regulator n=1 Tax=Arthrobacter cavernae TaxID=2817681 RepID=A0A939KJ61_9MICC|nr:Lrp/AsnC family transcriptional regulator [Arthrobacter cavernae]MBO1268332.1 Lrp/AsnC family transcriptional regulator [Arthrobacter cavernae]
MNKDQLDELDLQIINALQIEPRVPWTSLANVIGADSVTLSRRWERISATGLAWITAMHGMDSPRSLAIVEIQCEPGQALATAEEAGRDPAIYSIDLTSGFRDILMTLSTRNDDELAEYILVKLGRLPSVRLVRTHIVNVTVKIGSQWTLRALTPAQAARIPRFRPPRPGAAKVVPQQTMSRVVSALERNARATNVELSGILGMSPQRVGDAIATMRQQGSLDLRVDVAQPYSTWPTVSWYFIQVPSLSISGARETLAGIPEVQFAGVTTGQWNLIVALSARSGSDTLRLEAELERRLPDAVIMDRSMVVRVFKHLGRLLDRSGCATGEFVSLMEDR